MPLKIPQIWNHLEPSSNHSSSAPASSSSLFLDHRQNMGITWHHQGLRPDLDHSPIRCHQTWAAKTADVEVPRLRGSEAWTKPWRTWTPRVRRVKWKWDLGFPGVAKGAKKASNQAWPAGKICPNFSHFHFQHPFILYFPMIFWVSHSNHRFSPWASYSSQIPHVIAQIIRGGGAQAVPFHSKCSPEVGFQQPSASWDPKTWTKLRTTFWDWTSGLIWIFYLQ